MGVIFLDPAPGVNSGFDVTAQYQMVPAGGVRRMGLFVQADETEDCVVFVSNPNHASLFGLFVIQGSASVAGSGFFIRRNSAIRFFISGRDPGSTTLMVETVKGKARGFLLISVKPPLFRTYQLAIISDPIHVPNKTGVGNNLAINMLGAARIWLAQANVVLQRVGPINDVVVPRDLKAPIVIDDPANMDAIFKATFTKDMVTAHLFIFGTWDIVYSTTTRPGGSTSGNMCFVENQFSGRIGELMCAHEVGHALGLPHTDDNNQLLMTSSGIINDLLDMRDIETANRQ
jgi:hypothetical protein